MTDKAEVCFLAAFSDDRDKLLNWYRNQFAKTPYYSIGGNYFSLEDVAAMPTNYDSRYNWQHRYYKVFDRASILEWMNPLIDENVVNSYGQGIVSEWVDEDKIADLDREVYTHEVCRVV